MTGIKKQFLSVQRRSKKGSKNNMMPNDKKQREMVRQKGFRASILYHQKKNIVMAGYMLK